MTSTNRNCARTHVSVMTAFALSGCISLMTIVAIAGAVSTALEADQYPVAETSGRVSTYLSATHGSDSGVDQSLPHQADPRVF